MIDLKALRNVGNLHEFAELFGFDWDDPDWDWTWHDVAVKMADEIEAWNTSEEANTDWKAGAEYWQRLYEASHERTCHIIEDGYMDDPAVCSCCGTHYDDGRYCKYCGAKVISNE